MNTETKHILLIIIVCAIIMFATGYRCEKIKSELIESMTQTKEEVAEKYVSKTDMEEIEQTYKYVNVWATKNTDIKNEPTINSQVIGSYRWNTRITVTYIDDNWAKIKGTGHYINRDSISESQVGFVTYGAPSNTIKSYMDYRCITSLSSNQYKMQRYAYTDKSGIRMVNGRYCVAVGSYYTTTIGQYIDVELENGNVIQCILADCKDNAHTDATNRINPNGSVVEFVVDTNRLDNTAKIMGDISYINEWNSKVVNVKVYDKIEEF